MLRLLFGSTVVNSSPLVADTSLDITGDICPMTYVRTRLALDGMQPGQLLVVRLQGADAARNVPQSAVRQGHEVVSLQTMEDGATMLLLRRK